MTLDRLLRPRSIAVFGGKPAAEVVRQSDKIGFTGEIWPVHPTHDRIEGRHVFRSVAALPGAPDAAFVALNRHLTLDIICQLAARGTGGAVAYASGFSEVGSEGDTLQAQLIAAAGAMPVLGPNCYGLINYLDSTLLWPDQHGGRPVASGVAILTQSGNIACNLTQHRRALPIGYLITLGNQAAVDLGDVMMELLTDHRVTAIGLHIEGIHDPAAFARAALHARDRHVPIVAITTGRSEAGARLTVSHTASLAGADAVVSAFLRKLGIAQVDSLPVLLETLKLLHISGPMKGSAIASMSCSGGEAALIADRAIGRRVRFSALTAEQKARVGATTAPLVTVSNPLDYHTFHWSNGPALLETFAAMMACGFDMTALILDFPRRDRCLDDDWQVAAQAMIAARERTHAPCAVIASLPEALPEEIATTLAAAGVVPLLDLDHALAAMEAACDVGTMPDLPAPTIGGKPGGGKQRRLDEWASKRMLSGYGVVFPDGHLVQTPQAAIEAAERLGFPVAVKSVGDAIAHKTELGAVRLGLSDATAVTAAAHALIPLGHSLLVERMVTDAVAEIIVGAQRDGQLGPYLVVGSGGVLVELLNDSRVLILPASLDEVRTAIRDLRAARLLAGYRGRPEGDTDALIDTVLAVQRYVIDHLDRLDELDLNPIMVRPRGLGAIAVDALIRLREDAHDDQ